MEPTRRSLMGVLIGATASGALTESLAASAPAMAEHPMVARIWHGRTPADKADEYRPAILILAIAPILRKSRLCFGSSSDSTIRWAFSMI